MKKSVFLILAIISTCCYSQQLHQKIYSTSDENDKQTYSCIKRIPDIAGLSPGYILLTSTFVEPTDGFTRNSIVTRIDLSGNEIWSVEYPNTYKNIDCWSQVETNRIGFTEEGNVLIVGQEISSSGLGWPISIEFDIATGDVNKLTAYDLFQDGAHSRGHFNAIHSVIDENLSIDFEGSYMVGDVLDIGYGGGPAQVYARWPIIVKTGGTTQFSKVRKIFKNGFSSGSFVDVDVSMHEGDVVAVGYATRTQITTGLGDWALLEVFDKQ